LTRALLSAVGVSKYFGGLKAVDDVTFEVAEGEIVGLIGPNGAGKTTLFEIISGFKSLTSGAVFYRGDRVSGLPPHKLARRGIGRTFQIVQPFLRATVLENVVVGAVGRDCSLREARECAREILIRVGLEVRADTPARALTLPEKKRLELARALALKPDLLLLDEVMAGLTPREIGGMIELLNGIRSSGITLLIVEHVMQAIMALSDRIVVLANGKKIADDVPCAIGADEAVISAYLGRRANVTRPGS
jgi:branched-chain amino acid transport system ATP-binding protein